MRILVLSNFYPPYAVGGYELACQEVVEALAARGHEVRVLCSIYGAARPGVEGRVYRWLHSDVGPRQYVPRPRTPRELFRRELVNRRALRRLVARFRPQVVFAWNLTHVSLSLVTLARQLGLPVAYYVFDGWLAHWGYDRWRKFWSQPPAGLRERAGRAGWRALAAALGLPLRLPALDLRYAWFASRHLQQAALRAGQPVARAAVIYYGLPLADFPCRAAPPERPRRLLYAGQLVEHKGVHTALEALSLLANEAGGADVELTLAGGSVVPQYEAELRQQAAVLGLAGRVRFLGGLPRSQLPGVYAEHDILLFPSIWEEPFGITVLEAMASGLAVVATATGGCAEIVQSEANALVFPPGDAAACAAQIRRLRSAPALFEGLRRAGRVTVERRFQFDRAVTEMERALGQVVEAGEA